MKRQVAIFLALLMTGGLAEGVSQTRPQRADDIDLAGLVITMKRDGFPCGCVPLNNTDLSCCPAYSISISGKGVVTYEGISSVRMRGRQVFSIPVEEVRKLVEEFYGIDFFSLENKYKSKKLDNGRMETVSHSNGTTITLTIGGKTKSVYNFYGAPKGLNELQERIDRISRHLQR